MSYELYQITKHTVFLVIPLKCSKRHKHVFKCWFPKLLATCNFTNCVSFTSDEVAVHIIADTWQKWHHMKPLNHNHYSEKHKQTTKVNIKSNITFCLLYKSTLNTVLTHFKYHFTFHSTIIFIHCISARTTPSKWNSWRLEDNIEGSCSEMEGYFPIHHPRVQLWVHHCGAIWTVLKQDFCHLK